MQYNWKELETTIQTIPDTQNRQNPLTGLYS